MCAHKGKSIRIIAKILSVDREITIQANRWSRQWGNGGLWHCQLISLNISTFLLFPNPTQPLSVLETNLFPSNGRNISSISLFNLRRNTHWKHSSTSLCHCQAIIYYLLAMVPKLWHASVSHGGLVKTQIVGLHPKSFWFCMQGPRICIYNKSPGDILLLM